MQCRLWTKMAYSVLALAFKYTLFLTQIWLSVWNFKVYKQHPKPIKVPLNVIIHSGVNHSRSHSRICHYDRNPKRWESTQCPPPLTLALSLSLSLFLHAKYWTGLHQRWVFSLKQLLENKRVLLLALVPWKHTGHFTTSATSTSIWPPRFKTETHRFYDSEETDIEQFYSDRPHLNTTASQLTRWCQT